MQKVQAGEKDMQTEEYSHDIFEKLRSANAHLIMTYAANILSYLFGLKPPFELMNEIEWLMPYEDVETRRVMACFYHTYYGDQNKRTFILGINPGRFGAGLTGIPFTDPIRLEQLGI